MKRRNVTLSLPEPLLRKAKVVAARKETSLSELLREALEEKVREHTGYIKGLWSGSANSSKRDSISGRKATL